MTTTVRLAVILLVCVREIIAWEMVRGIERNSHVSCMVALDDTVMIGTLGEGVYRWRLGADTCAPVNNSLGSLMVYSLCVNGGMVLAGTDGRGVYTLGPSGVWRESNVGLADRHVFCLSAHESVVYAGTWRGGVYRSSDQGLSWHKMRDGLPAGAVYAVRATNDGTFAAVARQGVFWLDHDGTWRPWGLKGQSALGLELWEQRLFAHTWSDGVFSC